MDRPYRIPIPDWASLPFIFLPTLGIVILFSIASWTTYLFVLVVFVLGIAFHYLQQVGKKKSWCQYKTAHLEEDMHMYDNNEIEEHLHGDEIEKCLQTDRSFSLDIL